MTWVDRVVLALRILIVMGCGAIIVLAHNAIAEGLAIMIGAITIATLWDEARQ